MQVRTLALTLSGIAVLLAGDAQAHFTLNQPSSALSTEDGGKGPPPCGAGSPSNLVTKVQGGSILTVSITEFIPHPGHYRIALSTDSRAELPPDPDVVVDSHGLSVSAAIQNPPSFPILADGLFPHTDGSSPKEWTADIVLPNINCARCTLQVIEFMAQHLFNDGGGYFYHHCADLQITARPDARPPCPDFTRTNYSLPGRPRTIIAADFNGDGITDLLVGMDESTGNVIFFPGNRDGTFGSPVNTVTTIPFVWAMAAGDFNHDGKLDVAVTNEATVLAILLGNGDGTFAVNRFTVSEADDLYGLTVADLSGDGLSDLAMLVANANEVSIRFGRGDGTFDASTLYAVGGLPRGIVAADFNGDGKIDIATSNLTGKSVSVLLNRGDGTFATAVTYPIDGPVNSIASGDFNGDGKPDLAMGIATTVSILLNNGAGTFGPEVQYLAGVTPTAIATGDFDLDGKIDVMTANQSTASISLLLGNGDGTLKAATTNPVGTTPWGIAVGTFNGRPGVAVPNWGSNNVSVLVDGCSVPRRRAVRH